MKYLSLALGILAIANVIYSFIGEAAATAGIFGFEVNIWVYRLFWGILAIGCIFDYLKKSKQSA
jgi:hypothetical protein